MENSINNFRKGKDIVTFPTKYFKKDNQTLCVTLLGVMMKNNSKETFQNLVDFYLTVGIIGLDDVISASEEEIMNKILKQVHTYSIFFSESDNRWHTTIADLSKTSGRKSIARKKKGDLEKFLLEHYKIQLNTESSCQKTFNEIFILVENRKLEYIKNPEKLLSAQNTKIRNEYSYRRFFADTNFENKPVDTITKNDVEEICLFNLNRYNLKEKAFKDLCGILKSVFDMAYSEYWIADNIYQRMDFKHFKNMLSESLPPEKRMHSKEEISAILKSVQDKQTTNPKLSSAWALELQILMGLRRGELPPLTWDDIKDEYIDINKEQLTCGNDFITVNHTKNYKDRYFPLTDDLKDFLKRLKAMQDIYYPNSTYLFPSNTKSGVITNRAVYSVYQKICIKLGIKIQKDVIKGPHSFRRNGITDVVNTTNGNITMASELFGNTPNVAKQHYYTGTDLALATEVLNKRKLYE